MSAPETATQGAVPESGLTVRVEAFVGPLDLLLHLCRTNEMDLSRLSLRAITDQYLAHLESVQFQDLETAGSFMVMAATLIYLKSKLLLPANPDDPGEMLDEDEDLSVHLLQRAMQRLIEDQKGRVPRQIEPNPLSVLERMSEMLELLRSAWSLLFSSVAGPERLRAEWVVTLLALLELVRLGQARARQAELFGEIVIEGNTVSVREPARPLEEQPEDEPRPESGEPLNA